MRFIVSASGLLKNLQLVGGIIGANTVLPVLEDFLLELSDGTLTITGSDLETMIKVSMPVQSEEDEVAGTNGRVCVPSRILLDYLKNLPEQPVHFFINENMVEISSNTGKYKIGGERSDEFPKEPQASDTTSLQMPAAKLNEAIAKTIYATTTDTLRPAMTGVLFEFNPDNVTFVATDAHRLIKFERTDISAPEGSIIVPRKPLQQLRSILPNEDSPVEISFNNNHLFVRFDHVSLSCRLIDAKFPPYKAVIPVGNPYQLTINRTDLLSTLRRVSIFASKGTSQVMFDIIGNTVTVSAQDIDFSYEGNEQLSCQYNGEDMKIAFNAKMLIEMLGNLTSDEVLIELSVPSRAAIFRPSTTVEDEDLLMMLMPLTAGL